MDIDKYAAGRKSGASSMALHGEATLLCAWPAGFDPETGEALPAKEQAFQRDDLQRMRDEAAKGLVDAELAVKKAVARVEHFDALLFEADLLLGG
jgi:hypothetical protein